jgi:hypothetical protein
VASFRVTYHFVVEAETHEEAIAEAATVAESGELREAESRANVTVERIPDPEAPPGFVSEGVRRGHQEPEK